MNNTKVYQKSSQQQKKLADGESIVLLFAAYIIRYSKKFILNQKKAIIKEFKKMNYDKTDVLNIAMQVIIIAICLCLFLLAVYCINFIV